MTELGVPVELQHGTVGARGEEALFAAALEVDPNRPVDDLAVGIDNLLPDPRSGLGLAGAEGPRQPPARGHFEFPPRHPSHVEPAHADDDGGFASLRHGRRALERDQRKERRHHPTRRKTDRMKIWPVVVVSSHPGLPGVGVSSEGAALVLSGYITAPRFSHASPPTDRRSASQSATRGR